MGTVEELEDEAAAVDAELEDGDGMFDVALERWSPFDVETDEEIGRRGVEG